jgi:hypothetical protein
MDDENFMWGFSQTDYPDSLYPWKDLGLDEKLDLLVRDLRGTGVKWFRPHIHWNGIEPIADRWNIKVKEVTDELVQQYCNSARWGDYDAMIDKLIAGGINLFPVIGCGYIYFLPFYKDKKSEKIIPDNVGKENYLGLLYLYARAVVRRYKKRVKYWQIENELNVAGETVIWGWRKGVSWFNWKFLTEVLKTLNRAVKIEDPEAKTTMNFHTDVRVVPGIYDWKRDIKRWVEHIDIIGIDAYPNYVIGSPVRGEVVGKRVKAAKSLDLGKPVIVLETGYPSGPAWKGFNEARQAIYLKQACRSSRINGAGGFFYYCLVSTEGFPARVMTSNRGLQDIEPWLGIVGVDRYKPAWYAYREEISV